MSKKQNNRSTQIPGAASDGSEDRLLSEETARVRELIAGRHSKAALQLAKDLCKRRRTVESEALLVDAYKARIEDLLKLGMTVEAKTLIGIVRERFPAAVPQLADVGREISALDGRLEEVVGPLSDPSLPAEDRNRIETFIRQRIYDLTALAAVSSLPPDHPLRTAASALASVFQTVTQGSVDEELLELPEVSHRSPLASWKALVRAIASYHRREDEECRKWLMAIAGDSGPARLIPSFHAMLGVRTDAKFSLAEQKLIATAGDHGSALRSALAALEAAWRAKKQNPILDAARAAMAATDRCDAGIRERLRQHIAIRSLMQRVPPTAIHATIGGAPRKDAYYYRLLALVLEDKRHAESSAEAALVWEEFRREAIRENWFADGGLEDGVLSLHVAQTVEKLPPDVVEEMEEREPFYRKSGKSGGDKVLPSAGLLYERACNADRSPEAFQKWLNWANKAGPWQAADDVAERWRKARAGDTQPLLYLMESAEKRNAYKKSLKYLEEAEGLDRLNPAVRRAKLRLLLSAAIRHLHERKTHLVAAEIEQLQTVPEVRPGESAALAAGLHWCCAAVTKDDSAMQEREVELMQSMGNVAGHLLIAALVRAANMGPKLFAPPLKTAGIPAAELLSGTARACAMGEWAGVSIPLVFGWTGKLIDELKQSNSPLDEAALLVLGEAALRDSALELAYAVSVAGLAGGKAPARFLFLRVRSLPQWAYQRRGGCFSAALELARRERDTELAGRILDRLSSRQRKERARRVYGVDADGDLEIATRPVSPELLSAIFEEERDLRKFPVYERYREPRYAAELETTACDCPKCRAKRGEPLDDDEVWDEDEEDDPAVPASFTGILKMLEQFLGNLPPELAQKVTKALAAGEDPITAIDRIMGHAFPKTELPAQPKKEKAAKAPPPEQGSLF